MGGWPSTLIGFGLARFAIDMGWWVFGLSRACWLVGFSGDREWLNVRWSASAINLSNAADMVLEETMSRIALHEYDEDQGRKRRVRLSRKRRVTRVDGGCVLSRERDSLECNLARQSHCPQMSFYRASAVELDYQHVHHGSDCCSVQHKTSLPSLGDPIT